MGEKKCMRGGKKGGWGREGAVTSEVGIVEEHLQFYGI